MKIVLLLSFLFVVYLTPTIAQEKFNSLTGKDKALLIKSILLEKDLLNRRLNSGERKTVVNLSSENISAGLLPEIKGINFVLFNRRQIKEKIKTGFFYYAFESFKISGSKVLVSFGYYENHQGRIIYSGGTTYEFQKYKDGWRRGTAFEIFGTSS
jgi:hypothetical protein